MRTPWQDYEVSLAVCDHTMLLASCNPTQVNKPQPVKAGTRFTYLSQIDERLSWPRWLDICPSRESYCNRLIRSPTPSRCSTKTLLTWTYSYYCSSKDRVMMVRICHQWRDTLSFLSDTVRSHRPFFFGHLHHTDPSQDHYRALQACIMGSPDD